MRPNTRIWTSSLRRDRWGYDRRCVTSSFTTLSAQDRRHPTLSAGCPVDGKYLIEEAGRQRAPRLLKEGLRLDPAGGRAKVSLNLGIDSWGEFRGILIGKVEEVGRDVADWAAPIYPSKPQNFARWNSALRPPSLPNQIETARQHGRIHSNQSRSNAKGRPGTENCRVRGNIYWRLALSGRHSNTRNISNTCNTCNTCNTLRDADRRVNLFGAH
jgi:hypothetical protein